MLEPGTDAPAFELPNQDGDPVSLSSIEGDVVLYFYPKAGTRGCTVEACRFRDRWEDFREEDVTVLGVSTDSVAENREFHEAEGLPFDLLSDEDGSVARAYESFRTVEVDGETMAVAERNTYVIDANGTIREVYEDVSPDGHAEQILADI